MKFIGGFEAVSNFNRIIYITYNNLDDTNCLPPLIELFLFKKNYDLLDYLWLYYYRKNYYLLDKSLLISLVLFILNNLKKLLIYYT